MLKRRGKRIVTEHGLISNVLARLHLVDQLSIAAICTRTYQITVPWNVYAVNLPQQCLKNVFPSFPRIDDISDDFVCKRIRATIENEEGYFYGSVHKMID